jgi:hypothetical protein
MKKHEKYIERSDLRGANHLEVSVYYTKGGTNFFSGGTTPRGYYLSVRPVTKRDGMVSYELFSGRSCLLFETARFTDKQFTRAIGMAEGFEEELINSVVSENKAA